MRINNKHIDLHTAHPILAHTPAGMTLGGLDRGDGEISTQSEAEDVGGCRARREGVLGECGRGEGEELEEVGEGAGFDGDREGGFLLRRST